MHDSFAKYMKKEVVKYIKKEVDKGIPVKEIREKLIKGGHHYDLIEEAILSLLKHNFNLENAANEPIRSDTLAQELYAEVLASLIDYIEFQKKQGYTTKEIREILIKYGHSREILDSAIASVEKGRYSDTHFKGIRFILLGFALVIFLLWVSASTNDAVSKILVGFFPSIASLLVIGIMVNRVKYKQLVFLWLLPFIFAGVFIVLGQSGSYPIFDGMKIYNLAVLNVILSIIFALILISPEKLSEEPEPMEDLVKKERVKEVKREVKTEETAQKQQMQRPRIKEFRPI